MSPGSLAAVVAGPRRAELVRVPDPQVGPDQVAVAVEGCGVCGSNLPVWEGRPWFEYPLAPGAPGHEAWGRVVEVGADVAQLRVGDRVATLAEHAFAERIVVPARHAVPLAGVPDDTPFPGEALGCGFNVAKRSGFAAGQQVCVVGAGFLGCVVAALAAGAGATVTAVSRRRSALDAALAMGAHHAVQLGEGDAVADVLERTGGELCDVVVEAVGVQSTLDLSGQLTRERGRLVIAGFHQDGARTVDLQLWNWRGIDVVNAHERDPQTSLAGIREAVDAVAGGTLDPSPLYTHRFPLDGFGAAMDAMVDRPEGFVKALVCR